jgi:NitT/TauT family transport system substrate-binding protein
MTIQQTRRRLLSTMALAGAAGLLPFPRARAAEPAPEVTTVRLAKIPAICFAPQYVCEDLLRMEGFTDIRYVDTKSPDLGQVWQKANTISPAALRR